MDENQPYHIQINGQVDLAELNINSPIAMQQQHIEIGVTTIRIHTDQSGLMGMLRHLHARGFVILSATRITNGEIDD